MKLMLIISGLLILVCSTSGSAGKHSMCAQNPKLSCKTMRSAIKCDTVSYCIERVWKKDNKIQTSLKNYVECGKCHAAVLMFARKLQSCEVGIILKYILQFCNDAACRRTVSMYFPEIFHWLTNLYELSNDMCNDFCKTNQENTLNEVTDYFNHCELCTRYKDGIISSYNEQQFKEILDKICIKKEEYRVQCLVTVKKYYSKIFQAVNKKFHEKYVCYSWAFCPSYTKYDKNNEWLTESIQQNTKLEINTKPIREPSSTLLKNSVTGKNIMQIYPLCLHVIQEVQSIIGNIKFKHNYYYAINNFCGSLDSTFHPDCTDFLMGLYRGFKKDSIPHYICSIFDDYADNSLIYDTLNRGSQYLNNTNDFHKVSSLSGDSEECSSCKSFTKKILNDLDTNRFKEHLNKLTHQFCSLFPNDKSRCLKFEDTFLQLVDDFADQYISPVSICSNFGICSLDSEETESDLTEARSTVCTVCMYVVGGIQTDLKKKANQNQLKRHILKICSAIPALFRRPCINAITKKFNWAMFFFTRCPTKWICRFIHLC